MPTIYRGEVEALIEIGTDDAVDPDNAPIKTVYFAAHDDPDGVTFFQYGIGASIEPDGMGGFVGVIRFYQVAADTDPLFWEQIEIPSTQTGSVAALTSFFVIAIEKEFGAGEVRFITPYGTVTSTIFSLSDTFMRAKCVGFGMTQGEPTLPHDGDALLKNFWSREDGVIMDGAAMSAADPGRWDAIEEFFGGIGQGAGELPIPSSDTQNATNFEIRFIYVDNDPRYIGTRHLRCWNVPEKSLQLDTAMCPVTGTFYVAYTKRTDPDTVFVTYTRDNGVTLTEVAALSDPGWEVAWVNINVDQRGYVYLHFMTSLGGGITFEVGRSTNYGNTWESRTGLIVPLVEVDYLRVKLDPLHGFWYFFYWTTGGMELLMNRHSTVDEADTISPTPVVTVEADITNPQWPAILFNDLGFVYLVYSSGERRKSVVSKDFGGTWETLADTAMWEREALSDGTHWKYGLVAAATQGSFDIFAFELRTDVDLSLFNVTIGDVAPRQYAGLQWGSRNQIYFAYFSDDTPTLSVLRCDDLNNFLTPT